MEDLKKRIMQLVYTGALSAEDGAEIFKKISAPEKGTNSKEQKKRMDIAVIGIAGRFPKADNVNEYWHNLREGKNCISDISERWDISDIYSPNRDETNKSYSRWGGLLDRMDDFDPLFFELSPRQAELMEPRQRLFLMEAWKAIEDAGYVQSNLNGNRCGIFIGCEGSSNYFQNMDGKKMNGYSVLGHSNAILTARLAYYLNLQGPSVAVDTACSSSLVAIHEACISILSNDCDIAIAGGTTIMTDPNSYPLLCNMGMLSPAGKCKTFDDSADGFVPGECVAAVLLKPLYKAVEDKDHIYGIIKGSGSNQDGKTNSITAPSALSQERLERRIYHDYGIDPHTISYVEAHGTGTRLGDPIEIDALKNSFDYKTGEKQFCGIGSVKTNIGHTAAASGIASFIKVLLAMKYKQIPPSIHYEVENKQIDFKNSPFYVVNQLQDWNPSNYPFRRAAISSFGYGGTNCHLVVEEYQENREEKKEEHPYYLIPFSAKTKKSYMQKLKDYYEWLNTSQLTISPANLSYQLMKNRSHFSIRGCFLIRSIEELQKALEDVISQRKNMSYYAGYENLQESGIMPDKEKGNQILESMRKTDDDSSQYKEKLYYIMLCYLKGYELNWEFLYENDYVKLTMPGYSFDQTGYWLRSEDMISTPNKEPLQSRLAELIDSSESEGQKQCFKKTFYGNEFFLKDHNRLLPGVITIEMVREAAALAKPDKNIYSLQSLMWSSPITVPGDKKEVYVKILPKSENKVNCEVVTIEEGQEVIHFRAAVLYQEIDGQQEVLNVPEILNRTIGGVKEVEFFHECLQNMKIGMGDRLHGMTELHYNEKEALSRLDIHESLREGFHNFGIHPTLADGGLQTVVGWMYQVIGNTNHIYIPYSLGEFILVHPERKPCYAYVTKELEGNVKDVQTISYHIKYLDENGRVVYELKNFTYREFLPEVQFGAKIEDQPIRTLYYKENFVRSEKAGKPTDYTGENWVIFEGNRPLAKQLKNHMELGNTNIITVTAGSLYQCMDERQYVINPSNAEDYKKLAGALKGKKKLSFIMDWTEEGLQEKEKRRLGIQAFFLLSQALLKAFINEKTKLFFIQDGNELDAAIAGFAKTLVIEKAQYQPCIIETDKTVPTDEILIKEMDNPSDIEIRYQHGYRYVKQLHEIMVPEQKTSQYIRKGGNYLITGGAGGLGLSFAEHLINQYGAAVILTGRSELNSQKKAKIQKLNQNGERVFYFPCDISDRTEFKAFLEKLKNQGITVNGVLHAAGVIRDGLIARKQMEQFEEVLAPKMSGTKNIMECMDIKNLDFIVLFSSTTSALGNLGQCDYAYANSYMDHVAVRYGEKADKPRIVSINWPIWANGGMKIDEKNLQMIRNMFGMIPLETKDGIKIMENCLESKEQQLIILPGEVEKIRSMIKSDVQDAVPAETIPVKRQVSKIDTVGCFQEDIKQIISKILRLDMDRIDFTKNLSDFGFDSISFTDLASAINDKFDLNVTPALFFGFTFLDELVHSLWSEFGEKIQKFYQNKEGTKDVVTPSKEQTPDLKRPQKELEEKEDTVRLREDVYEKFKEGVIQIICNILSLSKEEIDFTRSLSDFGFDSISFTDLASGINEQYDLGITPAIFFGYTYLNEMVQKIWEEYPEKIISVLGKQAESEVRKTEHQAYMEADKKEEKEEKQNGLSGYEPIAIIGISGAMPKSDTLEIFWDRIKNNEDLITEIPKERWNWEDFYGDPHTEHRKTNVKYGAFMNEVDKFDPMFFHIAGFDTEIMDPQERLVLQHVWQTMEDAGYKSEDLSGTDTGIFIGISSSDYKELLLENEYPTMLSQTFITNRVSYILNIHGPSVPIDTACSSSFAAIHKAIEAIHQGECKMAFAGGVNVIVSPNLYITQSMTNMLSLDGSCKTFDEAANGYVRGEGIATILLKPLSQAEKDKDHIYGVIRGSAVNHGGRASNLFAPNAKAQADVIIKAHKSGNIDPSTVSYIETHGTGTALGDPIEIDGLKKAFENLYQNFNRTMPEEPSILLGSVKTNTGHLEAASGMAGMVKVLFAMRDHCLPKVIHFKKLNPYIHLEHTPFQIVAENMEWNNKMDENNKPIPRRAGISSFGVGGVNCHIVLEEYINENKTDDSSEKLFVLSAKDETALYQYVQKLNQFIRSNKKTVPIVDNKELEETIKKLAAKELEINPEDISVEDGLEEYGVTPFIMHRLMEQLKGIYHVALADYTLNQSVQTLAKNISNKETEGCPEEVSLNALAYTLQVGRDAFSERAAFLAKNATELVNVTSGFLNHRIKEYEGRIFIRSLGTIYKEEDIPKFIENKNLHELASLWVMGKKIDWSQLYEGNRPARISAPGYPFLKERYWFEKRGRTMKKANEPLLSKEAPYLIIESEHHEKEEPREFVEQVKEQFAAMLKIKPDKISIDRKFEEYGMDSIRLIEFSRILSEWYHTKIEPQHILQYETVRKLAEYLEKIHLGEGALKEPDRKTTAGVCDSPKKKEYENWGFELEEGNITLVHAYKEFKTEHFEDFWNQLRQRKIKALPVSRMSLKYYQMLQAQGFSYMHLVIKTAAGDQAEIFTAGMGKPLLMITGIGVTPGFYKYQIERFAKSRQVICFSMPGVGLSKDMEDLSLNRIAQFVMDSLDEIGVHDKMDIVGVSWGSLLACTIAYNYAERTDKMILGSPITNMEVGFDEEHYMDGVEGAMQKDFYGVEGGGQAYDLFVKSKCIDIKAFIHYGKYFGENSPSPHNVEKILSKIETPVLILYGEKDQVTTFQESEKVCNGLQNAQLMTLKDAAHLPMVTCPETFNSHVETFLNGN